MPYFLRPATLALVLTLSPAVSLAKPAEPHEDHSARGEIPLAVERAANEQDVADLIKMGPERVLAAEITVAPVDKRVLARKLNAPGTITPSSDRIARVPAKVIGTVTQMRKRLGDMVTQGEIVAVLDSREVADAKSEYLTAAVNLDLQKTMFERSQTLWNKQVTTEQLNLQARAAFDQAQLRFDLARQKLFALDINAAEVAALAKKDMRTPGALNLREYELRASISGRVVERKVEQGTAVGSQGDPSDLYTIADLSSVWVELAIPTTDLDLIQNGQRVQIASVDHVGVEGEGQIIFVSPLLNKDTRSARVIAELDNKNGAWRPGSYISAAILVEETLVAASVPLIALQTIDGEQVTFVRTPDGFRKRKVKTGKTDDQTVEILSGLAAGEQIAVSNTFLLKAELGKSEAAKDD